MKVKVHTSVIGNTGYNVHARELLTELNKITPIKIRNFSVGNTWKSISETPHDDEPYISDELKSMLSEQTLKKGNDLQEYSIYSYDKNFQQDINIVFVSENHPYFFQNYLGYNIAYCVTESTSLTEVFKNQLKKFHQVWVATEWQKNIYIEQGIDKNKIKVVNEGVNSNLFKPTSVPIFNERFSFLVVGRWEYRKSTQKIVETFLKTFDISEPVDLILLTDNSFDEKTPKTEDVLKELNINDFRIKTFSHLEQKEYIRKIQTSNVYLSCSRSEGWNLPLIEAMACGIPSIYSDCSGQLEFAKNKGIPVRVLGKKPVDEGVGEYYEPDYEDLSIKMRLVKSNYKSFLSKSKKDSKIIREKFDWKVAAKQAFEILNTTDFKVDRQKQIQNLIKCQGRDLFNLNNNNYKDGFKVLIEPYVNGENDLYGIKIFDTKHNELTYQANISPGFFVTTEKTYHIPWRVEIFDLNTNELIFEYNLDLKNKTILVVLDSSSLGDNITWFPQIERFRKLKNCKVICWTTDKYTYLWKENYPEIEFITGDFNVKAHTKYTLDWNGWSHDSQTEERRNDKTFNDKHSPVDYQKVHLAEGPANILDIDFKLKRPIINLSKYTRNIQERYVCINTMSTAQSKFWNYGYEKGKERDFGLGWQLVIYYLNSIGYKVVVINRDTIYGYGGAEYDKRQMWNEHRFTQVIDKTGREYELEDRISDLKYADFFIGLNSGMSWLAWMVKTPVISIVNLQPPELLVPNDKTISRSRLHDYNENICSDCCAKGNPFKRDQWFFCPEHYNTEREFECSTTITPKMVIKKIKEFINENDLLKGLNERP